MWKCDRCETDHSDHQFEFVHVVNRLGHHLRDEPNLTIREFYERFGEENVSVYVAPIGRLPAPLQFAAALSDHETMVGVIPSDEYLHEQLYPVEIEAGLWMLSNGQRIRAGDAAMQHEAALPTPISDLMVRHDQDVRAIPPSVVAALVPSDVAARVRANLASTPKGERVPPPFPYSSDDGHTWHFSDGASMTPQELLWDAESEARATRRKSVLERALKDRASTG